MSAYFLGVDGGQSSTTAIIGDSDGRVLGLGKAGPCNHVSAPEAAAKFLTVIGGCVREAAAQAGIGKLHFASACLGFSGGAEDKAPLLDRIFSADRVDVTHDWLIALSEYPRRAAMGSATTCCPLRRMVKSD